MDPGPSVSRNNHALEIPACGGSVCVFMESETDTLLHCGGQRNLVMCKPKWQRHFKQIHDVNVLIKRRNDMFACVSRSLCYLVVFWILVTVWLPSGTLAQHNLALRVRP